MTQVLPTLPNIVAGAVVQPSDLNAIGNACNFLLNKPIAVVRDGTGGVVFSTAGALVTYTIVSEDSDGMWNAANPNRLTVQTPGWYRLRYAVSVVTGTSGDAVNAAAFSTTGSNNPGGSGVVSAAYWASYNDGFPGEMQGHGLWPFYLYPGDFIQVKGFAVTGDAGPAKTSGTGFDGGAAGGSTLSLEWVGSAP